MQITHCIYDPSYIQITCCDVRYNLSYMYTIADILTIQKHGIFV